jgi:transposase
VIVIGVDPYKQSHTAAAVEETTGELCAEQTVNARRVAHERLLAWARSCAEGRLSALEDCRHVSIPRERFLLSSGERVVRVPPKLMAGARRSARQRGKSDAIDALAVARAALRERRLPLAALEAASRKIRLLVDHREDLVAERTRIQQRLRWDLHELDLELQIPAGALDRPVWLGRIGRRLARHEQTVQVRICRDLVSRCRALSGRARELERELAALVAAETPALLEMPGCGVLTAAKLIGEIGGGDRFADDARLAMHAGAAPLPASRGKRQRNRPNRSGTRQLNCTLHRIAVNHGRWRPRAYLTRKEAEGKNRKEAPRCLKRHPARVVYRTRRTLEDGKMISTNPPVTTPALTWSIKCRP